MLTKLQIVFAALTFASHWQILWVYNNPMALFLVTNGVKSIHGFLSSVLSSLITADLAIVL